MPIRPEVVAGAGDVLHDDGGMPGHHAGDGELALRILGRDYRPTVETLRDTIGFLRRSGRMSDLPVP